MPTAKPSSSEDWPPTISLPSTSIPYWSVPSGWPGPGGLFSMPRFTVTWLVWYSSGPAKQNRPSSTMIATPVIARLLVTNACRLSWVPAPEAVTSPPSGARGLPAGDGSSASARFQALP